MPQTDDKQQSAKAALSGVAKDDGGEKESIDRLVTQADDFFGHQPYVAAGAFAALRAEGITELTRKQGQIVIENWLKSPVA